jgi:hypothetical protein
MKEKPNKHHSGLSPDSRDAQITPEGIRAQLDRVLSGPNLKASKKVKTIFRYLTEETLAGREDQINAQSIANKAHNGGLDPDSPVDLLVRIQLNQLRRALKEYDAGAGATDDGPRIDIPQDRYTPVFRPEKK